MIALILLLCALLGLWGIVSLLLAVIIAAVIGRRCQFDNHQ